MVDNFATVRTKFVGIVQGLTAVGVDNVDHADLAADGSAMVMAITTTFSNDSAVRTAGWNITRSVRTAWAAGGIFNLTTPDAIPALELDLNAGVTVHCPADFMVSLASADAARADFDAACF